MIMMTRPERTFYTNLGRDIRAARRSHGWSQLDLALHVGLRSGTAIHYWETALVRPKAYQLAMLDRIFGEGWR